MDSIAEISYWYNLIQTYVILGVTWIYEHFMDFAWVVKVAAIILTYGLLIILVNLMRVFYQALKRRKWNKIRKRLTDRYGEAIEFILSAQASDKMSRDEELELLDIDPSEADPKKLLKDWREKLIMSRVIYKTWIADETEVTYTRNLHVLLNIFAIREFLEEIIVKDKLRYRVEALRMLRAFKTPTNPWISNQLFNTKRVRVQRLAMYASLLSNTNKDLEYYESDFFKENFCIYDEIQLGYVLQRRVSMRRKIPNLAHWAHIQTDARAQAMFVRLMRQFNQKEFCGELEELFQHNAESELIQEIASTWGYLKYKEGEELLRDMFLTQPDEGKVSIMHAITRLNSGESLNSLVDGYRNSGSQYVKFEALRCIYWYGEQGRTKFEELRQNALPTEKPLFEFFTNPLTVKELPLERSAKYIPETESIFSVG